MDIEEILRKLFEQKPFRLRANHPFSRVALIKMKLKPNMVGREYDNAVFWCICNIDGVISETQAGTDGTMDQVKGGM